MSGSAAYQTHKAMSLVTEVQRRAAVHAEGVDR